MLCRWTALGCASRHAPARCGSAARRTAVAGSVAAYTRGAVWDTEGVSIVSGGESHTAPSIVACGPTTHMGHGHDRNSLSLPFVRLLLADRLRELRHDAGRVYVNNSVNESAPLSPNAAATPHRRSAQAALPHADAPAAAAATHRRDTETGGPRAAPPAASSLLAASCSCGRAIHHTHTHA